jgi:phosphohistidine phosphatase
MKTLLILRHAKSSHDDDSLSDHDRPLAKRGQSAAKKISRLIDDKKLWPDLILSSTAERAAATARRVVKKSKRDDFAGEIQYHRELYLAEPEEYVAIVQKFGGEADSVMVVGHNPGMEDLIEFLAGEWHPFPTAALARIELSIDDWADLAHGTGEIAGFWRPRKL